MKSPYGIAVAVAPSPNQRLMVEAAMGDGELAAVEGFVLRGEEEDVADVGCSGDGAALAG